ncbi:MAG: hypothetical protein E7B37_13360 [Bradyrhizobium sp.]|nr:hypothetical protein [Bradyrhizobium sp.]MDU3042077.1 hypothetical protein [Bradyrhizobium sp.]
MPDPMRSYLDFEKPVAELDSKVDELRAMAAAGTDIGEEVSRIEEKAGQALADLYANLTPWQKTMVARHPQRPHFTDFVNGLITEFTPLAGDRKFGGDHTLFCRALVRGRECRVHTGFPCGASAPQSTQIHMSVHSLFLPSGLIFQRT